MKIEKSKVIYDLCIIHPEVFYDFRGENVETYNKSQYDKTFENLYGAHRTFDFVVDSFSFSTKNVLRGFHGDLHAWKLVQCIFGSIYFVVIDVRKDSPTFNKHEIFSLNEKNRIQILIPNGCVNAHLCLSNDCIFNYKLTYGYVKPEEQLHVKWNDPFYNIYWPIKSPCLSNRDF